jgi:cyanophycinase
MPLSMCWRRPTLLVAGCVLTVWNVADAESGEWQNPDGRPGTLILVGGGSVPDEVPHMLVDHAGEAGQIFVLADAAEEPDTAAADDIAWLTEHGADCCVSEAASSDTSRPAKVAAAIDASHGVWIGGGQQSRLAAADPEGLIEASLQRLLDRGGVIAGTSAGAAIASEVMIAGGRDEPEMATGWDLLPGAIVDQHFHQRNRLERSRIAVARHPGRFGVGIDEGTAIVVRGRRLQVIGENTVTVSLSACSFRPAEDTLLRAGDVADITQLQRAARRRAADSDPGVPVDGKLSVPSGSLVIVGGGGMPEDAVARFVELAGGPDARIVILPTAVPRDETDTRIPAFLRQITVKSVKVLPQRGPEEVQSDEFRTALSEATGIWFGGGRQWNFVDAYEGTAAVEMFHQVLERGGVIGGSSAGATIQGEFLVRGHPLGNSVMMAEGYERGFAFLPGVAIDQHFSQRDRQPDLIPVIRQHSQMIGLGIDEGTAVVVRGNTAEVIGQHAAHFLSARSLASLPSDAPLPATVADAAPFYVTVPTGSSIELTSLKE